MSKAASVHDAMEMMMTTLFSTPFRSRSGFLEAVSCRVSCFNGKLNRRNVGMASQGASLQNYNNELVKCERSLPKVILFGGWRQI